MFVVVDSQLAIGERDEEAPHDARSRDLERLHRLDRRRDVQRVIFLSTRVVAVHGVVHAAHDDVLRRAHESRGLRLELDDDGAELSVFTVRTSTVATRGRDPALPVEHTVRRHERWRRLQIVRSTHGRRVRLQHVQLSVLRAKVQALGRVPIIRRFRRNEPMHATLVRREGGVDELARETLAATVHVITVFDGEKVDALRRQRRSRVFHLRQFPPSVRRRETWPSRTARHTSVSLGATGSSGRVNL